VVADAGVDWARARVAIAQGEPDQADRDAHDTLAIAASMQAYFGISDTRRPGG
jgi:hypothetical protein